MLLSNELDIGLYSESCKQQTLGTDNAIQRANIQEEKWQTRTTVRAAHKAAKTNPTRNLLLNKEEALLRAALAVDHRSNIQRLENNRIKTINYFLTLTKAAKDRLCLILTWRAQ